MRRNGLAAMLLASMTLGPTVATAALTSEDAPPPADARVAFWNIPSDVVMGIAAANREGGIDGRFTSPDLAAYDAYVLFIEADRPLDQLPYAALLELERETIRRGVTRITREALPPVLIFGPELLEDGYDPACVGRLIHRTVVRAAHAGAMPVPQLAACDSAVLGPLAR